MKVHCTIHIRNKISITGYARAGNETVLSRKQTRRDRLDLVSSRDFRLVTGSRIRIALTWNTPGLLNLAALCSPLCPRSSTTFASAPPSRRAFTTAPSPPRWEATSRGVVKPDPNWTRSRKKVLRKLLFVAAYSISSSKYRCSEWLLEPPLRLQVHPRGDLES